MVFNCGERSRQAIGRVDARTTNAPSQPPSVRGAVTSVAAAVVYADADEAATPNPEEARTLLTRRAAPTRQMVELTTPLLSAMEDVGTSGVVWIALDDVDTVVCQASATGNGGHNVRSTYRADDETPPA